MKANLLMKQFTHWLDPEVMQRVHDEVGKQKISEFVRLAIQRELDRRAEEAKPPSAELKRRERKPKPGAGE